MAYQEPNKDGFYGKFGGRFVPETLMTAVLELEKAYRESQADPSFQEELNQLLRQYVGCLLYTSCPHLFGTQFSPCDDGH